MTNVKANLIGGATISFGYLINYLDRHGESYTLINTKRFLKGPLRYFNPLYILIKVLLNIHRSDVLFLNSSRGGAKFLAPVLYYIAKIFQLKFVFRPFGGDIKDYTAHWGKWATWFFDHTILKADLFFLQTKELMNFYANRGANLIQLPTSREAPPASLMRGERPYGKRLIYLGFVNEAKGIDHILEAAQQLGTDYTLHIFGPLMQDRYRELFARPGVHYQGVLKKGEVLETLRTYDVLLLPTYYEGEGYPGAVIEAYSLGLPVIATDWKAIPEIVPHGRTGRLIAIQSTEALVEAIQFFTTENYPEYSENARSYFVETFSSEQVTGRAIKQIKTLFLPRENLIKTH
ncbi:MAG: glycosyltransferase family 4 protein [Bacteroidota bacterium]